MAVNVIWTIVMLIRLKAFASNITMRTKESLSLYEVSATSMPLSLLSLENYYPHVSFLLPLRMKVN